MSAETIPRAKKVCKELGRDCECSRCTSLWGRECSCQLRADQSSLCQRAATALLVLSHSCPCLQDTVWPCQCCLSSRDRVPWHKHWALIHLCFQCRRQCDENQKMAEMKRLLNLLQTARLHRCWCEGHTFSWLRWLPEGWELPFLAADGFLLTCAGHSPCSPCPQRLNL